MAGGTKWLGAARGRTVFALAASSIGLGPYACTYGTPGVQAGPPIDDDFAEGSPDATEDVLVGDAFADGEVDGPLFDVGDLGTCTGTIAKEIPAPDCEHCFGDYAYALCEGVSYATCSCTLPPGYTFVEAGAEHKGSKDAAPSDSASSDSAAMDAASLDSAPKEDSAPADGGIDETGARDGAPID
jgi:hypothetical protein